MFPTVAQFAAAVGSPVATVRHWYPLVQQSCDLYGIDDAHRLAPYLATIAHESRGLTRTVESMSYTAHRLLEVWPNRFTAETAAQYAGHPEAIACHVYGNRLGNCPEGVGNDGWKYRGRGLIQVTGKINYEAVTDLLLERLSTVPDFVISPDAMSEPRWAAFSAAALWHDRGLNDLADAGDFRAITRKVNGGMEGWADRNERLITARRALA